MAARMVTWSLDMVSKMYRMIFLYQQIQGLVTVVTGNTIEMHSLMI